MVHQGGGTRRDSGQDRALAVMYTGRAIEALQAGDRKKAREWSAKGEATRKKLDAMDERQKQTPA